MLMFGFVFFFESIQTLLLNPYVLSILTFGIYLNLYLILFRLLMSFSGRLVKLEFKTNKLFNIDNLYFLPSLLFFILLIVWII